MSYKALLFCPDGKTVRVVTQVLSELDFTVEPAGDPFATVKKLTDEHFDALVVDCQNEQDASLLFKGARNSSLNHSSLYVAVVEGQAGVAKAFRIGANLVLTKPINIEQSKSTLRVARGLLRKHEAKPAALFAQAAVKPAIPIAASVPEPVLVPPPTPAVPLTPLNLVATPSAAPFAMLELEHEPTPAPEPTEAAMLESMPDPIAGKPSAAEQSWAPPLKSSAQPIAASTAGTAAGVAPALEKPAPELKSAPPLATQDPITADVSSRASFEAASVPVPTFSSYAHSSSESGGGKRTSRNVAVLLILLAAGYFGWQKLHPLHYLSHSASAPSAKQPISSSDLAPVVTSENLAPTTSSSGLTQYSAPASRVPTVPHHYTAPEMIQAGDVAAAPEPKITVVPKPQPLLVKTKSGNPAPPKPAQPTPPSLAISASNNSDTALANIVSANAVIPKGAPASLRVSQGVSQGLLVKKVSPVYPPVALQLRKQGSVELMATISKEGAITRIKVLGGDSTLAQSAADAVRQWKYRPYLLNGEPVEIETQITIHFKLP